MGFKSTIQRLIKSKWTRAILVGLGIPIIFFISTALYIYIYDVPDDILLKHPDIKIPSTIYDAKGRSLGMYMKENRVSVSSQELNPKLVQATIAAEDVRFYEHHGIDYKALGRVLVKSILMNEREAGGGSTITQQLAKQLFPRPTMKKLSKLSRTWVIYRSKLKEWFTAIRLEKIYSKTQIIEMYLNKFEFINGAHGIEAAALTYFAKHQSELNYAEVATLVGMLQNPSLYNPIKNITICTKRRNEVLDKMTSMYHLTFDTIKSKVIDISHYQRFQFVEGPVPYFKNTLAKWLENLLEDQVVKRADGSSYNIYGDGLKIYTTIDLDYQKYAEEAANEHLQLLQAEFWKEWKNKDAWTYEANAEQKAYRQSTLIHRAKSTLRYAHLLAQHHGKVSEKVFNDAFYTAVDMEVFDLKKGKKNVRMSPMDSIRYHAMHLQNAFITMDVRSGRIKSWLGGLDYNYFKIDHAMIKRSIGSTMKPFLYTTAMTYGKVKPCQMYKDQPYSIGPMEAQFKNKELWAPHNATEIYTTLMYNLYHGLLYSKNSVTVKLLKDMGTVEPLRDLLDKVGLDKNEKLSNGRLAIPSLPSIALGAVDIDLLQLLGAYGTFANGGVYQKPIFVDSIVNREGQVIYKAAQVKRRAIDPLYNAIMVDMLRNVVSGEFTMGLKSQSAGKTGTTNDQSDGWFMGFTPTIVGGVWTGGDDKWVRFTNIDIGQGYFTARPIFERFIKKLEADKRGLYDQSIKFPQQPEGFKELTNCAKIKTEPLPEFLRPKQRVIAVQDSLK